MTAWTYTVINKTKGLKTSCEYAKHILAGLHEHHAPCDYIKHVKARILKSNPDLRSQL